MDCLIKTYSGLSATALKERRKAYIQDKDFNLRVLSFFPSPCFTRCLDTYNVGKKVNCVQGRFFHLFLNMLPENSVSSKNPEQALSFFFP